MIYDLISPGSLSTFEELPPHLLWQVVELSVISDHKDKSDTIVALPTSWVSSLLNLLVLDLVDVRPRHLESSHLFFSTLASFSKLRILKVTVDTGILPAKEVSKCIAGSHSLEDVTIMCDINDKDVLGIEFCCFVEASLSCPKLRKFKTNISFFACPETLCSKPYFLVLNGKVSPNLQSMKFEVDYFKGTKQPDCLCCIASMCKMSSMKSLEIYYEDAYISCLNTKFLVILNHSLYCNPFFANLKLDVHLSSNYQRCIFSNALRSSPSLLLNRSKSLTDLSTLRDNAEAFFCDSDSRDYKLRHVSYRIGKKCQSCPDMLQMQSLHDMHPLLRKALKTDRLYFKTNRLY